MLRPLQLSPRILRPASLYLGTALLIGGFPLCAREPRVPMDVAATVLPDAIAELARESGVSIGAQGDLPRVAVRPVRGTMSISGALARMLARSGYRARKVGANAWRIEAARRAPPAPAEASRQVAEPPPAIAAPIIVTATKEALSLDTVPGAISVVIPEATPGPSAAAGTGSFAAEVEGLALTGEGPGRNRMFVRGVADSPFAGRSQATVAVLLGDARITWSAPDPDIRLVDVKQVELLKGPQGSLYGSGALGGIYRIVPNRADLSERALSAEVSGDAIGSGDFGVSASAVANLPLLRDVAAVRLVTYGERIPGWIDTGTHDDINSEVALGWRADLATDLGRWKVDLSGLGQALNSADSSYVYAPDARSRPAQVPEPHDNDLIHGALRVAREGGPVTFLLSSGITRHSVNDRYDATVGADGLGIVDPLRLDDERLYTVFDSELRANGEAGRVRWLAGASWLSATQRETRTLTGATGDMLVLDADHRKSTEVALYGQATVPVLAHVEASAGGRLFRATLDELRTRAAGGGERIDTRWGFTPSFKLAWRPLAGRLIYASYDSAIREGGATLGAGGALTPIKGDELATFAAGWRESRGPVRFDLGLYHSRWTSVQSDVLRAGGLIEPMNVGNGTITGAELELEATVVQHWRVSAGGMIQSALLDGADATAFGEDRRLPVTPSSTLRFAVMHDFRLAGWAVTAGLRGRYVGRGRLSFDPVVDRPLGNYLDSSADLSAARGPWSLGLTLRNLLDAREDIFVYGNPLRILTMPQHVTQAPRSLVFTVGWKPGR